MPWEITDDEARASFEVVDVESLPPIERDDIKTVPASDRNCGCYWCEADWPVVAKCAVTILQEGVDPLDHTAVASRGRELGIADSDVGWLLSLFSPRATRRVKEELKLVGDVLTPMKVLARNDHGSLRSDWKVINDWNLRFAIH